MSECRKRHRKSSEKPLSFSQLFKLHNEVKDYFESREKNTEHKDDFENHQSRRPPRLFASDATVQRNAAGKETPLVRKRLANSFPLGCS